ncbi:ATP-binding protein [Acidithrix sp. C25]|jgi:signal transduction histidine kinase|uniref:sensor histidine kinase n=1 Tax=Acidithrix sp. C25 TaxID=1671482 RepID=UPI00191BBC00|nr:ATP-binding protein [Acidithrix sp. C25]
MDRKIQNEVKAKTRSFYRSVRARTTFAAVLVVSLALFLAGVVLLRNTLDAFDQAAMNLARTELGTVSIMLHSRDILNPLPAPRGDLGVQIIDSQGRVVASTGNFSGLGPITKIPPAQGAVNLTYTPPSSNLHRRFVRDSNGVIVGAAVPVSSEGLSIVKFSSGATPDIGLPERSETPVLTTKKEIGPAAGNQKLASAKVYVFVWASLASREQSINAIETSLFVVFPLLVILVGLIVWFVTGLALSPVEKIRSEVSDISGSNLHRRVFVPQTKDEIAALAFTMNAMLDRIEVSTERQRQFVSDASHELRSPISSIRAELEVALLHPEATDIPQSLNAALDEAQRMQRIVADLLTLAKLDEKVIRPSLESVDLDEIISAEARRVRIHNQKIVDATRVSAARVRADRDQIIRVIRNLLENAARHSRSTISIGLRTIDYHGEASVELRIGDDGPGIAPEMREKVFERFHRVDEDRARISGGSGLGLSIVAALVELHQGTIEVSAEPAELGGAEFILHLPIDPDFADLDVESIQQIHT